jgi:L-threonylcarbamoyladenylate synthase
MTAPILPPTTENVARVVEVLRHGGLVAIPTETVYGVACDAANPDAVAKLYAAKGRPSFNPLIAHVANLDMARLEGQFNAAATALAKAAWPGPLTLVTPLAETHSVCDLARAGLATVALRQPAHPVAANVLAQFGGPLVAPSANPSGRISPTCADHVASDLGKRLDLILDGGTCKIGVESTILSCLDATPKILRYGGYDASQFAADTQDETKPTAPGALSRHYAPDATLRLNVAVPISGDAYLAFGPTEGPKGRVSLNLSETGDLVEAAANLFAMLRQLDRSYARIAVAPIPMRGLGLAINDRLVRAAKRD